MVAHSDIDHTGLTGIPSAGAGAVLQVVTATAANNDQTTAATLQASSLSASITPQANDSKLIITVDGECNATRVAGSTAVRHMQVAIRNTTDAVTVALGVRGRTLIAASSDVGGSTTFEPIALKGIYTVNSTAARTFQLQFMSSEATNVQANIRGDRTGGVVMTIMEIAV